MEDPDATCTSWQQPGVGGAILAHGARPPMPARPAKPTFFDWGSIDRWGCGLGGWPAPAPRWPGPCWGCWPRRLPPPLLPHANALPPPLLSPHSAAGWTLCHTHLNWTSCHYNSSYKGTHSCEQMEGTSRAGAQQYGRGAFAPFSAITFSYSTGRFFMHAVMRSDVCSLNSLNRRSM